MNVCGVTTENTSGQWTVEYTCQRDNGASDHVKRLIPLGFPLIMSHQFMPSEPLMGRITFPERDDLCNQLHIQRLHEMGFFSFTELSSKLLQSELTNTPYSLSERSPITPPRAAPPTTAQVIESVRNVGNASRAIGQDLKVLVQRLEERLRNMETQQTHLELQLKTTQDQMSQLKEENASLKELILTLNQTLATLYQLIEK